MAKKLKRISLALLGVIATIALLIVGVRAYNDHVYGGETYKFDAPAYFSDPANLSLYPTNIDGVDVRRVDDGAAQGFHLVPREIKHKGTIIVYGGSDGTPNYAQAVDFAKNGYEVMSLFMFGQKNQPKTLARVPLEQFEQTLRYVEAHARSASPLTVMGVSKGAEYALNLTSKYPQINNAILAAPSAYNFNGLDFENYGSSWTWQGKELPYIDIQKTSLGHFIGDMIIPMIVKAPVTYKNAYQTAVDMDKDSESKKISLNTKANILIIAGSDDQMWNSAGMGKSIKDQRPQNTDLAIYGGAGHVFAGNGVLSTGSMRMNVGGTTNANTRAARESHKLMYDRLQVWHP
jgi:acyl-coA thioesterase